MTKLVKKTDKRSTNKLKEASFFNSYDPHAGFIGQIKVPVANYLFELNKLSTELNAAEVQSLDLKQDLKILVNKSFHKASNSTSGSTKNLNHKAKTVVPSVRAGRSISSSKKELQKSKKSKTLIPLMPSKLKAHKHSQGLVDVILSKNVEYHYNSSKKLTEFLKKRDLTFSKSTPKGYKIFTVPCTTSVIPLPKSLYNQIEKASQRFVATLRLILQDLYGAARPEESAFIQHLPEEIRRIFLEAVHQCPQYFPQLHHPEMKNYPFFDNVGLDLVLVEDFLSMVKDYPEMLKSGRYDQIPQLPFKILELNAGSPSGASNNMNIMQGLGEIDPEILESVGNVMPNDHYQVLGATYKSLGEEWTGRKDGVQIILPPGGGNGAAPEIHQLAAYSGLIYTDPCQLYLGKDEMLHLRTLSGDDPIVTAIYSRINADSAHSRRRSPRPQPRSRERMEAQPSPGTRRGTVKSQRSSRPRRQRARVPARWRWAHRRRKQVARAGQRG